MAQGTGYTYSQRGDVVLATRTGTTRNQPSNYKPFKLLKGVDTVITFFIKDVNGCPVKLHEKNLKAQVTKHDEHMIIFSKNLRVTDPDNGVATLRIQPGDIEHLDLAFYNILLTYTDADNVVTAMHADQNYRYCYVAEIEDCGAHGMTEEVLLFDDAIIPTTGLPISQPLIPSNGEGDWFLYSTTALTANLEFSLLFGISFRGGLALSTSSLTAGVLTGCHASVNVTINISLGIYVVVFVNIGIGYQIGDQIVIQGSQLGGIDGTVYGGGNDLVITVTDVDSTGGITNYNVSGTPYMYTNTYVSRALPGPAHSSGGCHGLNTFSVHSRSGVRGTLNMQVTLSQEPGENDWFDVKFPPCGMKNDIPLGNPTSSTTPVTEAHAIDGMFLYVRFKMTINIGRVDKILYRR